MRRRRSWVLGLFALAVFAHSARADLQDAPYPASPLITGVTWDWNDYFVLAPGSDNWPLTWAADDHQYTIWGDGGGFRGDGQRCRVSLGVGRVEGSWQQYVADPDGHTFNVWGCNSDSTMCEGTGTSPECAAENPAQFKGKSYGVISVNGTLYAWWGPLSGATFTDETRVMKSTDMSQTWTLSSWAYTDSDNLYGPTFLNFGQDNAGARDGYVYSYFPRGSNWQLQVPGRVDLARVAADQIMTQSAYEWFAGFDNGGDPIWTSQLNARQHVFEDPNGLRLVAVTYNPGLGRYLLTTHHGQGGNENSNLAIFEGSEPWGPWNTVAYLDNWGVVELGRELELLLAAYFAPKWFSPDGRDFTVVFSDNDHWGAVRGHFNVAVDDSTPPSAPSGLQATDIAESSVTLSWNAASDPESGILSYRVYRDGIQVASPVSTTVADTGLQENTSYNYQVSAVNGGGLEGPTSPVLQVTTLADTTPPTITDVHATGATRVLVSFSESVEPSSAQNASNYSIDQGVSVSAAMLQPDGLSVQLTTSTLSEDVTYTLSVGGIRDTASTPNEITPGSTGTFTYEPIPTVGLVSHWPFEGNANDAVGPNGGIVVGPEAYSSGVVGQALGFDGTYVDTGSDASLDNLPQFTFAAWIRPDVSGDRTLMSKASSTRELRVAGGNSSLYLRGCVVASSSNACSDSAQGSLALGPWQHVAMTYDDDADRHVHLFIDGVEVTYGSQGLASGGLVTDASSDLNLGRRTSGDRFFDGRMDEARIYNRALSPTEIAALYQSGVGPPVPPGPPDSLRID